jgi:hypothetical protein
MAGLVVAILIEKALTVIERLMTLYQSGLVEVV